MKNVRYISVQPRLLYYAWQVEVMINNFLKFGVNPNFIDVLVMYSNNPSDPTNKEENAKAWHNLSNKYNNVRFFFYKDSRLNPIYTSSVRPNILKQHFIVHPQLEHEAIFYHDCDIVFTRPPNFIPYTMDKIWYVSNTNNYINYNYVISKGEDVYKGMCDIIKLDHRIPQIMNSNSGGAQYLLKGVNASFWAKVEKNCEELYKFFTVTEARKMAESKEMIKENPTLKPYHPIQKWTSDMWALLWNGWFYGNETKVHPYFNFCWATDDIKKWNTDLIYHNAGVVVSNQNGCFFKGAYTTSLPYNISLDQFNPDKCSYNYVKEIIETGKNTCLLD